MGKNDPGLNNVSKKVTVEVFVGPLLKGSVYFEKITLNAFLQMLFTYGNSYL